MGLLQHSPDGEVAGVTTHHKRPVRSELEELQLLGQLPLQVFKGLFGRCIPDDWLLGALFAIFATDLEFFGQRPCVLGVMRHVFRKVIAQAKESTELSDGPGFLPFLNRQQFPRGWAAGSLPQDVPTEFHLPHEEMRLFWAGHQGMFPERVQHSSDVTGMVGQEFIHRVSRRTDDDVIDVGIGALNVAEHPFHHALKLRTRIFQPHDLHLPLHSPPGGGHACDVPVLLLHGHLVIPICQVKYRPHSVLALPLQDPLNQGQRMTILNGRGILRSEILD